MDIHSEQDINSQTVRELRKRSGLTQKEFWRSNGLTQSGGSYYEKDHDIPEPVRKLVFLQYVIGIKVDCATPEGIASLRRLARLQASEKAGNVEQIGETIQQALAHIQQGQQLLASINE